MPTRPRGSWPISAAAPSTSWSPRSASWSHSSIASPTLEGAAMQKVLEELLSITVLVAVIGVVVARLPKIDVGHTKRYRARRVRNWVPVGLMYALLYMGRYNLTVS